ncbi:hypothetical protein CBS101457_004049 [Exobasidium rhododendri]|nr:hypothetical protein CBS101457_004049 [Exobasidium rhododendri]
MVLISPTPTPLSRLDIFLEERQGVVNSIIDTIASVIASGTTSASTVGTTTETSGTTSAGSGSGSGSGSDTTTTAGTTTATAGTGSGTTSVAGSGGTTVATSTSTLAATAGATTIVVRTSTSPQSQNSQSTATSADSGGVVTQISTLPGGSTVVIRSTASNTATGVADSNSTTSTSSNGGLIGGVVGGVVGGLALLTAVILLLVVWRRRRSRTGNGWFLCFGTRPKKGSKDFEVDWPTFDPTSGAAGVGGTLGARTGRGRNQAVGGTLPEVDDGLNHDNYENEEDMRELGSGGHGSYSNYYNNAAAPQAGYSAGQSMGGGSHSNGYHGPSDEGHFRSGGWAPAAVGATAAGAALNSQSGNDSVPTYDHLDPPEVREARAKEHAAEAHAMASHSGGGVGQTPNSPPMSQQYSPGYYPTSSPPPHAQRDYADHRLSSGTTQALAASQYFDGDQEADSGTLQTNQQRMLHLHNPDA